MRIRKRSSFTVGAANATATAFSDSLDLHCLALNILPPYKRVHLVILLTREAVVGFPYQRRSC
jgi:hypothetical protein